MKEIGAWQVNRLSNIFNGEKVTVYIYARSFWTDVENVMKDSCEICARMLIVSEEEEEEEEEVWNRRKHPTFTSLGKSIDVNMQLSGEKKSTVYPCVPLKLFLLQRNLQQISQQPSRVSAVATFVSFPS